MTNAIKTKTIALSTNTVSIYIILSLIICSIVSYIFFVNKAVHNVTALQKMQSTNEVLVSKVSDLESEYFAARDGMTINKAKQMGFSEVQNPLFISKTSGQHLSINKNN